MPYGSDVDLGTFQVIPGTTASALDDDLIPSTNVSQFSWISFYIGTTTYAGLLNAQISYDETTWRTVQLYPMVSLDAGDVSGGGLETTNAHYGFPVIAPFFRVRMTSYTSGASDGFLYLSKNAPVGPPLLDIYVRILSAENKIGFINNDGTQHYAIPVSTLSDTAVSITGGMLARILVTESNSHEMVIYDSDTGATGDIVGMVVANKERGSIIECHAPVGLGIYVVGDTDNPGVTIFFH